MPRGGRRPGAGAPFGNTNAIKHGLHSKRYLKAIYLLVLFPELRAYIRSLFRQDRRKAKARYEQLLVLASQALKDDARLDTSIRQLVLFRREAAAAQIPGTSPLDDLIRELSDNQPFISPLDELPPSAYTDPEALSPDTTLLLDLLTRGARSS